MTSTVAATTTTAAAATTTTAAAVAPTGALMLPARKLQLEELFGLLDTDHSGTLEVNELINLFKVLDSKKTADDVKKDFAFMDDSKDGRVQKSEFIKHYLDFHAKETDTQFYERTQRKRRFLQRKPALSAVFDKFDGDKSGFLTKGELYRMVKLSKPKVTNEEVVALMAKIDSDHDHKVARDEFIRYWFREFHGDSDKEWERHIDMLKNGQRKVKLQVVFDCYDLNSDGILDLNEFSRMLRMNGRLEDKVSAEDILDVLGKIDKSGDHKVDFSEFLGYVSPLLISLDDHHFNLWCHRFIQASKGEAIKRGASAVKVLIDAAHADKATHKVVATASAAATTTTTAAATKTAAKSS